MNTPVEDHAERIDTKQFAYIRAIAEDELAALPNEALVSVEDTSELFVITNGDGEKLAIIEGEVEAYAAAKAHALVSMSVH